MENRRFRPNAVSLTKNFRYKGRSHQSFLCTDCQANGCLTTLSLTVLTQRNFVADFLQASAILDGKMAVLCFYGPFGGLGATYDNRVRLIEKRVVDFLLVLIEVFLLGVTAEALYKRVSVQNRRLR